VIVFWLTFKYQRDVQHLATSILITLAALDRVRGNERFESVLDDETESFTGLCYRIIELCEDQWTYY
jgi:hypothetical protein